MSCKLEYKGKFYTEKELKLELIKDPAFVAKYLPQEERFNSGDYTKEDIVMFKRKVDRLQETMDVKVIMDPSVETSRTLGSSDPRVKAEGKPVILINPNAVFKTTAIHEFGHIFLDSFPNGIENPRLKRAYEMLKGTELEAEVKALYPELNDEMFAKELITTAIGRKGSEIWDSESNQSTWAAIKNWMLDYIKRTFGFSTMDEIESLTKEILSSKIKSTGLSTTDQLEKVRKIDSKSTKEEKAADKSIKTLESVYKETVARVENIYKEYTPEGKKSLEREDARSSKGTTRFESITELKEAMDDLDNVDRLLGIEKYIDWVRKEVYKVTETLEERKKSGKVTDEKIMASIQWNRSFSMIEDIQGLIVGLYEGGEITKEQKEKYDEDLTKIQGDRSKLETRLLEESRKAYAKFIGKHDNKVRQEYEREFEKNYETLGIEASGQSLDSYVKEKLHLNAKEIRDKAEEEAYNQSHESISDIHGLAAIMWSEKNANSQDIQILSGVASWLDQQITNFSIDEAAEFDTNNKKFKVDVSNAVNQATKYNGMYDTSKSGQSYYAGEYKAEFNEQRSEMIKNSFDRDNADEKYGEVKVTKSNDSLDYTINGENKKIKIYGATRYNVETNEKDESFNISFELFGERVSIPTSEAVGKSEYEYWLDENVTTVIVDGYSEGVPNDKWINNDYKKLSEKQKGHLEFLKEKVMQAEELTGGKDSIVSKKAFGQTFIRLPGILKSDTQRIVQGNYKDSLLNKISQATTIEKDDFESQGKNNSTKESFKRVYADVSNKEKMRVPIPFRARLNSKEQSLDLHTITLMNLVAAKNYQVKSEMESTFLIVLEVMKNRKVPNTTGLDRLKKVHALSKEGDETPLYKNKEDINDAKKARDILENRFYGIKSKDAGRINLGKKKDGTAREVDINAITRTWLKFSGYVSLTLNWINSVVNLNMGTINNLIEAAGGEHFNFTDWGNAGKKYWLDINNIKNDWGSNVDKSRTNLFMNAFDVLGSKEYLDNKFEENTRAQALLKMDSLRPIAKAGEHMMQAKVMYATLNHIKVMNKNGDYLDINGKVVKDKKQAASLDEMIEFKPTATGGVEIVLHKDVDSSTHTRTGGKDQVLKESINLVKYKIRELHGNYDSEIQAAAQREFWGKMAFFLRKWVEEGYFRRWRSTKTIFKKNNEIDDADRFYSQDAKANREGYYVTATRFLTRTIAPAIIQMNIEILKEGAGNLSTFQKANLKKVMMELGMIALTLAAYLGMDEDDDEVDAKYIFRRQLSELSFFVLAPEAIKVVSTPTASIGTLRNIFKVINQSMNPFETYQQGPHKGRNKLNILLLKNTPVFSQWMKDSKSSLDFLNNSAGMN